MSQTIIRFHEVHVPQEKALEFEREDGVVVDVLDATPIGHEIRFRYVTTEEVKDEEAE